MNTKPNLILPTVLCLAAAGPLLATFGFRSEAQAHGAQPKAGADAARAPQLVDAAIEPYRTELLELAFAAASAFPLDPHVKNRSRAQEVVALAALELGQTKRALAYADRIVGWRRGAAYAEIAWRCALEGEVEGARPLLARAVDVAASLDLETSQDWHRDRILAGVARTHAWLGEEQEAAGYSSGLVASEVGTVEAARSARVDADGFDEQLRRLTELASTGGFDQIRGALDACVRLHDRFYAAAELRERAEQAITSGWTKLPVQIRIELSLELAESALAHEDAVEARELLAGARALLASVPWVPEDEVALRARLGALRHRAGEPREARAEADAALALYESKRAAIVDMFRAGALRPLAECFHTLGDTAVAREVYARAIEEGVLNPNSRPRADDLGATACSMAVHGVEPSEELWKRMVGIRDALGAPW